MTKDRFAFVCDNCPVEIPMNGLTKELDALENAEDRAAVRASVGRFRSGEDDGLPAQLYRRLRAGEHPIRVWRAHRKMTLNLLAERAAVSRAYLSEIETGKKPGSAVALQRIARVLRVDLDDLVQDRPARKHR